MKKTVLALVALSFAGFALADTRLVGTWQSKTAENGALKGSLTFGKNGAVTLQPEGFPPVAGTWKVTDTKKHILTLTLTDIGSSGMSYTLNKGLLTLTYDNGNLQQFTRQPAATGKK